MAFLHCTNGSGGSVETIEGTVEGVVNAEWTVTSQQGKTPKRAMLWMSMPNTAILSGCYWNAGLAAGQYFGQYKPSSWAANVTAVGAANNYNPNVKSVGANSITFKFGAVASYINGTFTYRVEFE